MKTTPNRFSFSRLVQRLQGKPESAEQATAAAEDPHTLAELSGLPEKASAPEAMIAGNAPRGLPGQTIEPAWHRLAAAHATNYVRLVHTEHEGRVYYIGCREEDFDGAAIFTTRLAAGLPGHPKFKGDGAYLDKSPVVPAMLFVQGGELESHRGSLDWLLQQAHKRGLPVIELDESCTTAWKSYRQLNERAAWHSMRMFTWAGAGAWAVGFALCLGGLYQHRVSSVEALKTQRLSASLQTEMRSTISALRTNPLEQQMGSLRETHRVLGSYADAGLVHWSLTDGRLSLEAYVPVYVRDRELQQIAPNLLREETTDGRLRVRTPDSSGAAGVRRP